MKYLDNLRAYAPKRLIAYYYDLGGLCCVLGACVPALTDTSLAAILHTNNGASRGIKDASRYAAVRLAVHDAGLRRDDAAQLEFINDRVAVHDSAQRYDVMLRLLTLVEANKWHIDRAFDTLSTSGSACFLDELEQRENA